MKGKDARRRRRLASFAPQRVWVVAVPVVFALVLESLVRKVLIFHICTARFDSAAATLVAGSGPFTIRTGLIALYFATGAYALVWAVFSIAEVLRLGRGGIPGSAFNRAVATTLLVLMAGYLLGVSIRIPTAEAVLADARAEIEAGSGGRYLGAVRSSVPGVDDLSRELRDGAKGDPRYFGALGLYLRGDRSPTTLAAIHEKVESVRKRMEDREPPESSRCRDGALIWTARFIQDPATSDLLQTSLPIGDSFWEWWKQAERDFRPN